MKQFTLSSRILHDYFSRRKRFGAVFFFGVFGVLDELETYGQLGKGREGYGGVSARCGLVRVLHGCG